MTVHAVKDPDFLLAWFFSFHGSEEESEVGAEERVDTDKDVQTEDRTITFK